MIVVVGRMQSHSEVCSFHQTFECNFKGSSNATPVYHAHYYPTAFARAIATCLVHYGEQNWHAANYVFLQHPPICDFA